MLPILSFFDKELSFPLELGRIPVVVGLSATFFRELFRISSGFLYLIFNASSSTRLARASRTPIMLGDRAASSTNSSFLYYFVMLLSYSLIPL